MLHPSRLHSKWALEIVNILVFIIKHCKPVPVSFSVTSPGSIRPLMRHWAIRGSTLLSMEINYFFLRFLQSPSPLDLLVGKAACEKLTGRCEMWHDFTRKENVERKGRWSLDFDKGLNFMIASSPKEFVSIFKSEWITTWVAAWNQEGPHLHWTKREHKVMLVPPHTD